jgi:hypothetical protein
MRKMRTIALVDHTRKHRPPAGVLEAIAEALTIQVQRDFAPAWGVEAAQFTVGGRGDKIHFFDSAHEAEEFGWHVTDHRGLPYAHVFAAASISHGNGWTKGTDAISVTASHEALEMLGDPRANEFCFDGDRRLWAREVCDPVQSRAYKIRTGDTLVPVSNFVLPAYFNPWAAGPYDQLGVLDEAFSIDTGGYAVFQRTSAEHERFGRGFGVTFDDAMPEWQRTLKLRSWGRTYWRLALNP